MCDFAFPRWFIPVVIFFCVAWKGSGTSCSYGDELNGNSSLECTRVEFIVTVILYPPHHDDNAKRGVIRDLTISCIDYEGEIEVTDDQSMRRYNDVLSFNVSSVGYNGSCTLCGLYEDATSFSSFQFPSRSCTIDHSESPTEYDFTTSDVVESSSSVNVDYSFTPTSDAVESPTSVSVDYGFTAMSDAMDYEDRQLVLVVVVVVAISAVLSCLAILFLIFLSYWVWKLKDSQIPPWPDNVPYVTDVVQTFDPDFNPVKINDAATNFSSAESVQDMFFSNELSSEFSGQHSVHTDTSGEGYDSSSSDSYLVCSQASTDTDK